MGQYFVAMRQWPCPENPLYLNLNLRILVKFMKSEAQSFAVPFSIVLLDLNRLKPRLLVAALSPTTAFTIGAP